MVRMNRESCKVKIQKKPLPSLKHERALVLCKIVLGEALPRQPIEQWQTVNMWCCQHEQIMIRHVSFTQLLALTFDYQTTTKNHNKYPINLRIASNITTNTKIYYPCVIKMAYFIPNSSSFLIVNSTTIIHSLKR